MNLVWNPNDLFNAFSFVDFDYEERPGSDALRIQKYTGYFHANIVGLRDDVEAIDAVTEQYGVEYSKSQMPDSALGYSIAHPTDIFVLDPQGQIVDVVPHDTKPKYLLARIRDLMNASD